MHMQSPGQPPRRRSNPGYGAHPQPAAACLLVLLSHRFTSPAPNCPPNTPSSVPHLQTHLRSSCSCPCRLTPSSIKTSFQCTTSVPHLPQRPRSSCSCPGSRPAGLLGSCQALPPPARAGPCRQMMRAAASGQMLNTAGRRRDGLSGARNCGPTRTHLLLPERRQPLASRVRTFAVEAVAVDHSPAKGM